MLGDTIGILRYVIRLVERKRTIRLKSREDITACVGGISFAVDHILHLLEYVNDRTPVRCIERICRALCAIALDILQTLRDIVQGCCRNLQPGLGIADVLILILLELADHRP